MEEGENNVEKGKKHLEKGEKTGRRRGLASPGLSPRSAQGWERIPGIPGVRDRSLRDLPRGCPGAGRAPLAAAPAGPVCWDRLENLGKAPRAPSRASPGPPGPRPVPGIPKKQGLGLLEASGMSRERRVGSAWRSPGFLSLPPSFPCGIPLPMAVEVFPNPNNSITPGIPSFSGLVILGFPNSRIPQFCSPTVPGPHNSSIP